MTSKQAYKSVRDVFMVVIMVSTTLGYCYKDMAYENFSKQVQLKDQVFRKERSETHQIIATQNQRILDLNAENMKMVQTINDFKKIQGQTSIATQTIVKEVRVPYEVIVEKYIDTLNKKVYVRLPLPFSKNDSFYSIHGKVELNGLALDSLKIPNQLTITTGLKKNGFFRKDEYIVEVVSDNPYTDITKLNNTQFKAKTPWWKSRGLAFGLGFLIPILIIFK